MEKYWDWASIIEFIHLEGAENVKSFRDWLRKRFEIGSKENILQDFSNKNILSQKGLA